MKVEACCYVVDDTCLNCGACIDECPKDAIYENEIEDRVDILREKCNCCVGISEPMCVSTCPVESIVNCPITEN